MSAKSGEIFRKIFVRHSAAHFFISFSNHGPLCPNQKRGETHAAKHICGLVRSRGKSPPCESGRKPPAREKGRQRGRHVLLAVQGPDDPDPGGGHAHLCADGRGHGSHYHYNHRADERHHGLSAGIPHGKNAGSTERAFGAHGAGAPQRQGTGGRRAHRGARRRAAVRGRR